MHSSLLLHHNETKSFFWVKVNLFDISVPVAMSEMYHYKNITSEHINIAMYV